MQFYFMIVFFEFVLRITSLVNRLLSVCCGTALKLCVIVFNLVKKLYVNFFCERHPLVVCFLHCAILLTVCHTCLYFLLPPA